MKSIAYRLVLLSLLALFAVQRSQAQNAGWHTSVAGDLELAVLGSQGALVSTLESGYNGAWWFGNPFEGNPFTAVAQTFSVDLASTLDIVELRVAQFGPTPAKGSFEVALYTFDAATSSTTQKLAAVQAHAEDFAFPLQATPVSFFDFSAFHLKLSPSLTYALTITPLADFRDGLMALHGTTDIYPHGEVYVQSAVPEPEVVALCFAGVAVVGTMGSKKQGVKRLDPTS